ncbi:MAG TPA: hypothetical protein ENI12_06210, partial [Nitrospirae bacterium]|nr:hypothetical protein [Nitrospirota bacterium]
MKLKLICMALALILSTICAAENSEAVSSEGRRKSHELTLTASEHMNLLEYDKALPLLEEAIKLNPENQSAMRYLLIYHQQAVEPLCKSAAEAYYSEHYLEALNIWDKIIVQVPSESRRIQPLIDIAIIKTRGKELERKYEVAYRLIKEGRHGQAQQELKAIIREFPQQERAKKLLADISGSMNSSVIKEHYTNALD